MNESKHPTDKSNCPTFCDIYKCSTICETAESIAKKLNLDLKTFLNEVLENLVVPEIGCIKAPNSKTSCKYGYTPNFFSFANNTQPIVAKKFVTERTRTGPCAACAKYDGKIFYLPGNALQMPSLPIHPNCKCHYEDFTLSQIKERNKMIKNVDIQLINTSKRIHIQRRRQMSEAAISIQENLTAEKNISQDEIFFIFNGRYLYSSDGKFIVDAVAGKPTKISTHKWINGGSETVVHKSLVFDYSKDKQTQKDIGPLPEGVWSFDRDNYGSLLHGNIVKHGLKYKAWGKYHWSLIPSDRTNTFERKRDSFTIHGGTEYGSAGCIDLKHEIDEFHSYVLKLPQKKIFLYAKYPEETIEIPAD